MEGGRDDVPRGSTYNDRSSAVNEIDSLGGGVPRASEAMNAPSVAGLAAGVMSYPEPPGAPWGGAGAELRHCLEGHTFDYAAAPLRGPSDEALKGTLM